MKVELYKTIDGLVSKLCSGSYGCGQYLPLTDYLSYKTKQGITKHLAKCYECRIKYMHEWSINIPRKQRECYTKENINKLDYGVLVYPVKRGKLNKVFTGMFGS